MFKRPDVAPARWIHPEKLDDPGLPAERRQRITYAAHGIKVKLGEVSRRLDSAAETLRNQT